MEVRLEHSDFKEMLFPDVCEPVRLQKRYEGKMPEQQIAVLESFLSMEAEERCSAKNALRSKFFQKMRALHRDPLASKSPKHREMPQHVSEESSSPIESQWPKSLVDESSARPAPTETALPAIGQGAAVRASSEKGLSFYGRPRRMPSKKLTRGDLRTPPEDEPMTWDDDFSDFHVDDGAYQSPQRVSTPQVDMYRLPWESSNASRDLGVGSPTPVFADRSQSGIFPGFMDSRSTGTRVAGPNDKGVKAPFVADIGRWQTLGMTKSRWSGA
jgi:hypothetical protein